jgi:SAM-dependent methyltransferase
MASKDERHYADRLSAEGRKWGHHLAVEASHELHAWLDHPSIRAHYEERGRIDGQSWKTWMTSWFGGPAKRSMELGCGSGTRSVDLYREDAVDEIEGADASAERVDEAEERRIRQAAPGRFRVEDVNRIVLPPGRYDLVFSAHSFHHFLELEHVMTQVLDALSPNGLFVLEEFVGPTQFQWSDAQIEATRDLLFSIPERYRILRWGAVKDYEARPTVEDVVADSPFESIRSAEIVPLFERYFDVVHRGDLGGTIQQLLYNGIMRNFRKEDPEAEKLVRAVWEAEDALVDSGLLPSDFQLLVGRRP